VKAPPDDFFDRRAAGGVGRVVDELKTLPFATVFPIKVWLKDRPWELHPGTRHPGTQAQAPRHQAPRHRRLIVEDAGEPRPVIEIQPAHVLIALLGDSRRVDGITIPRVRTGRRHAQRRQPDDRTPHA
jgi:hypothetical protein